MIQPLPTPYAGCRFRSRLEARWAVFFDAMRWAWDYEPEGFATSAGNYLPDFRVNVDGESVWFEVKPDNAPVDLRHQALANLRVPAPGSGFPTPIVVARGLPENYGSQLIARTGSSPLHVYFAEGLDGGVPHIPGFEYGRPCALLGADWGLCLNPGARDQEYFLHYNAGEYWDRVGQGRYWYDSQDINDQIACYHCCKWDTDGRGSRFLPSDSPSIDAAYAAARSARFGT